MRASRSIVLTVSLLMPLGMFSVAGEPSAAGEEKPAARSAEQSAESAAEAEGEAEVLRFTNADLKPVRPQDRYADPEAGEQDEPESDREAGESLDEALEDATQEAIQSSIEETRGEIAELELRLEHLNSRLLSVKNPLLKGVNPPSREEEEAVGGLSNTERLSWVNDQIAATEAALAEAQSRMSDLLRR